MVAFARECGRSTAEVSEFFGITCDETDRFCEVFRPPLESLGFSFSWRRQDEYMIFTVCRLPDAP